jgi:hypothetical protein
MLSQDEVLHNSPMLRALKPFVPVKTRNWSAVFARSGHVNIFLAENLPASVDHLLLFIVMATLITKIFAIGVAFVEKHSESQ